MIDFHSHILPGIDDGAKDLLSSEKLIEKEKADGIDTICLTSHFYAKMMSFSEFIEKRDLVFKYMKQSLDTDGITFVPGAETYYYRGISDNEEVNKLKLKGTDILLLEMPFQKWTDYEIRELQDMAQRPDTRLMIAHFERYLDFNDLSIFENLISNGALIQCNAGFFLDFWNKRKALKLLKNGYIDVVGSDAHSIEHRPPKLKEAFDIIEKNMGKAFLDNFIHKEEKILGL